MGHLIDAIAAYENALSIKPEYAQAWHSLGDALLTSGNFVDAVKKFRMAISIEPDSAESYHRLGSTLVALGQPTESVHLYRHAIELNPALVDVHNDLGNVLIDLKRLDEAYTSYSTAISIDPTFAVGHFNLGNFHFQRREYDEAIACYETSIDLNPDGPEALTNLGIVFRLKRQLYDAVDCFERALKIAPEFASAHTHLGIALASIGQADEAVKSYRRALDVSPGDSATHSNLIHTMAFLPGVTGEDVLQEALVWDTQHSVKELPPPFTNNKDPERRLRIGYVSANFRNHAAAFILEPLLAEHDPNAVEVFCYAQVGQPDATTERFKKLSDHWRSTVDVDDMGVNAMIRNDEIDILIECTGHTASNRLTAISSKPAPIVVNYYPIHGSTSGMVSVDFVLGDPNLTPPSVESQFSEKLINLKHGSFIFHPNPDWPRVAAARDKNDTPVFACVGTPDRISSKAIELWMKILEMVPGAQLLFKNPVYNDPRTRDNWQQKFQLPTNRVTFEGVPGGWGRNMDVYERIDVILDTIPVEGGTSVLIPLWMGVPVVTVDSHVPAHRFGAAMMRSVGIFNLVASDEDNYLEIATGLISDKEQLAELRRTLREQVRNAPICDARGCARGIEAALREMWKNWAS